jgi:hypothetical protein
VPLLVFVLCHCWYKQANNFQIFQKELKERENKDLKRTKTATVPCVYAMTLIE